MTLCRRFGGAPVTRLIVSVPADTVVQVDRLIAADGGRVSRAEFVRLAIADKLKTDLMISRGADGDDLRADGKACTLTASKVETDRQNLNESST